MPAQPHNWSSVRAPVPPGARRCALTPSASKGREPGGGSFSPKCFCLFSCSGLPQCLCFVLETLWGAGFGQRRLLGTHRRPGPKVGGRHPLASFLGSGAVNQVAVATACRLWYLVGWVGHGSSISEEGWPTSGEGWPTFWVRGYQILVRGDPLLAQEQNQVSEVS